MYDDDPNRLLSTAETAGVLGVTESAVRKMREQNRGPNYAKVGGTHVYVLRDVLTWKRNH